MALQADLLLNASGYNYTLKKAHNETIKSLGDAGTKGGNALAKGLGQARGFSRGIGASLSTFAPALGNAVRESGRLISGLRSGALAGGGMGVAIGASVLGVGLLAGGWIKIVDLAADYSRELAPLMQRGFLPMAGAQAREAEAGLKAITMTAKGMVVVLGDELAPQVQRVSRDIVALGIYGMEALGGIEGAAESVVVWLGQRLVKAFLGPATLITDLARGTALLADATGADGLAGELREVVGSYDAWTRSIAQGGVDRLSDGLASAERNGASFITRADALIGAVGTLGAKASTTGKALAEMVPISPLDLYMRDLRALDNLASQAFDGFEASMNGIGQTVETGWQALQTAQTNAARAHEEMRQQQLGGVQSFMSNMEQITANAKSPVLRGLSNVFVAGQILLNSFLGASRLWATGNPLAMGLGAGLLTTGAALSIQALAVDAPESRAIGATALPSDGLIQAHRDEIIIPAPVAREMPQDQRSALVRGQGTSGPTTWELNGRPVAKETSSRFRSSPRYSDDVARMARTRIAITGRS